MNGAQLHDDFVPYQLALKREAADRVAIGESLIKYGVSFLDDALVGLPRNALVLLGAKTGAGKTQIVTTIAHNAAATGKRVHFFALEAEPNEIQRRMKFQLLSHWFWNSGGHHAHPGVHLNYSDWLFGLYGTAFAPIEANIESMLSKAYANLHTYYRKRTDFTVPWFRRMFESIKDKTDLVIVDHLHYFDFDDDSENRAMKAAMKAIRDCVLIHGKPVILVAHMRKLDRMHTGTMPDLDDFHGTSDLSKIATDVVILAPGKQEVKGDSFPTLMRAAKLRRDGSRTRWVGVVGFNPKLQIYDERYELAPWREGEKELAAIEHAGALPHWAKRAKPAVNFSKPQIALDREHREREKHAKRNDD